MATRLPHVEHHAHHVATQLLAAPAELLLDALPPLEPLMRFLVGAGLGLVARAMKDRVAGLEAKVTAVDASLALTSSIPRLPGHNERVVALPHALPFLKGSFDVALANLVVGDAFDDAGVLVELRRVLKPGGWLLLTILLDGSFEELFDVFAEACEGEELHAARASLVDARTALFTEERARALLSEAGLSVVHTGVEERALFFSSGRATVDDPLVRDILAPSWLKAEPADLARARGAAATSIDTYFGASRFSVKVRTGIFTARARPAARRDAT
jgi:SAM-dependent methyltransferase